MQEIDDHLYTHTREFCLRCFTLAATYERNYIQNILPWFNPRPWCNPPVVWSAPLFWYDPVINTRVWYGISVYVARSFDRPSFIRTPSFSKHLPLIYLHSGLYFLLSPYDTCFMIHSMPLLTVRENSFGTVCYGRGDLASCVLFCERPLGNLQDLDVNTCTLRILLEF